jgi:hypothetical protein
MQKKLIVGLGLVMMTALGAGACSSSSSTPNMAVDGGPEMDVTVEDSATDSGTPMDTGTTPVPDAPSEAAPVMEASAGDGGDAAPTEAGGGDGAVGDAE